MMCDVVIVYFDGFFVTVIFSSQFEEKGNEKDTKQHSDQTSRWNDPTVQIRWYVSSEWPYVHAICNRSKPLRKTRKQPRTGIRTANMFIRVVTDPITTRAQNT